MVFINFHFTTYHLGTGHYLVFFLRVHAAFGPLTEVPLARGLPSNLIISGHQVRTRLGQRLILLELLMHRWILDVITSSRRWHIIVGQILVGGCEILII